MASVVAPVKRVVASRDLLWNLTLRELRTKYRKSVLGWTWSMLNPLATVAIYSFVFGVLFRAEPPVGENSGIKVFALYLLCGILPWNFFILVTGTGMQSMLANAGLVKKVAFPREVLVFANSLHGIVQFSIEMGLLTIALLIAGSIFKGLDPDLYRNMHTGPGRRF
jgi:ABC-2 type transport system permease protein